MKTTLLCSSLFLNFLVICFLVGMRAQEWETSQQESKVKVYCETHPVGDFRLKKGVNTRGLQRKKHI